MKSARCDDQRLQHKIILCSHRGLVNQAFLRGPTESSLAEKVDPEEKQRTVSTEMGEFNMGCGDILFLLGKWCVTGK